MIYQVSYWAMVIGYAAVSLQIPSIKMKVVGILLTIVNAILFWK